MTANKLVRWHVWFHWSTEKFEHWLEDMAAQGWHLVKTDRLMHRSHFERGRPKKVRYCVDYPREVTDEYYTIYNDAGWEMVSSGMGWYIWRIEYHGERRPELFNDAEPLIERNNTLLLVCAIALLVQPSLLLGAVGKWLVSTPVGRILLVPYSLVMLVIVAAAAATFRHNQRLKARKP